VSATDGAEDTSRLVTVPFCVLVVTVVVGCVWNVLFAGWARAAATLLDEIPPADPSVSLMPSVVKFNNALPPAEIVGAARVWVKPSLARVRLIWPDDGWLKV